MTGLHTWTLDIVLPGVDDEVGDAWEMHGMNLIWNEPRGLLARDRSLPW